MSQEKIRSRTVAAFVIVQALAGAGLVTYGLSMVYVPAAWIFAGAVLWLGAVRFARQEKADAGKTG